MMVHLNHKLFKVNKYFILKKEFCRSLEEKMAERVYDGQNLENIGTKLASTEFPVSLEGPKRVLFGMGELKKEEYKDFDTTITSNYDLIPLQTLPSALYVGTPLEEVDLKEILATTALLQGYIAVSDMRGSPVTVDGEQCSMLHGRGIRRKSDLERID
jgi:hypothetical protein